MSKRAAVNTYRRPRDEAEKVSRRIARYPVAVALVDRGIASEPVRIAVGLLREGHNGMEIAKKMGLRRATVYALLGDPHGTAAKARKAKAQRPCVGCGKPCNTDGSVSDPSERCAPCAKAKASADAKWQRPAVIAAIQRWAEAHDGEPPKANEWKSGLRGHPDYATGEWPAWNTVAYRFGSFNAAIEAAGFKPKWKHGGQPRKPLTRQQLADTAALVGEHGLGGAATRLGLTEGGVKLRLKKFNNESTGGRRVPGPLTAEAIIDRELAKHENKATRLREELDEIEKQAARLKVARDALREPLPA